MPSPHIISMYDIQGTLLGRLAPIASARYTRIMNDVGDFEITFPLINPLIANYALSGTRIEFAFGDDFTTAFAGIVRKRQFVKKGRTTMVTVSGPSYLGLLADRRLLPPPATEWDAYVGLKADNAIKQMVRKHLGSLAAVERRVPNLIVAADAGASATTVNYNGRYEPLIDATKDICKQAPDVKYNIERNASSQLEFKTYVPILGTDKSVGNAVTVQFDTAGGNVSDVEYIEDGTPIRNYAYGGGPGDGAARMIREGVDTQSVLSYGRIEDFVDASSVDTTDELDIEILKRLSDVSQPIVSLSFKINVAGRYEYGTDFRFGDKVTALWHDANEGLDLSLTDEISGITVALNEGGPVSIDLSIGQPNLFRLSPGRSLASYIRGMRSGLSVLQRH